MAWLTPEQILQIPSEKLGILILHRLGAVPENVRSLHAFTNEYFATARPAMRTTSAGGDQVDGDREVVFAKLADAWSWLEQERYLGPDARNRPGDQWRVLTPRAVEILTIPIDDAVARIHAADLLGAALHPRIETQVRGTWNAGDFETAIFKAAREIEIAVGECLPARKPGEKKLYGVDVMNAAFGKGKHLSDPQQEAGEQEGIRALYAGFLGTFKNPGSHRHFEPADPAQAAGILRTADLLMRMLDDIARQLGATAR